ISRSAPGYIDAAGVNVRPVTTTTYDGVGNIVSSAQLGNGQFVGARLTRYSYNGNGQLTEMTDAARNVVRYNFDAQGDLASQFHINVLTSGGNQKTIAKSFQYDGAGRLVRTLDVDTGETQESRYNAFGEVVAQGSNGGWQEWFEYTALGKVWKTNSGDGAVKFFLHDANGNVTRDLRIGLGSSTTRDLRNVNLADVLADATLVSTVHVYDARNQEVRTLQPRIARLASEATLAEQFTDTWVSQGGDLNATLSGSIATPGHSTATVANGSRTPLTGGVPGTAPGGSGNSTGTAVSVALPSGSMAVLAGLNPSNTTVILPGTTAALTQAAIALQIPSTWPVGHYRVRQTLTGPGTTGTTTLTEVATPGGSVMVGGGSPNTCQIDVEWQPSASNVWQPIAQMSLAKLANLSLTSATFTWTPITNANTKVTVDLTPESGWGNATQFQLLVDPDDPARTQVLGLSRPPGGRLGIFDLANLVIMPGSNDHQLVLQAFDSNGHLVGGRKYKVAGTDAGTLAEASGDATLYAGGDGTVWARNGRAGNGQVPFAMLYWDLGAAHAGDGTLRWRKAGATGDPWNSTAISAPSGGSAFVIGGPGTTIADGSYFFVLEQGDARVTGSFKLTGGALTLDDSRLKPLALTPERVTINGPVDTQGRGRVALTVGSVTVTATTDANGQASFDLSQIRQSLGLDRWSVASRPFSYQGYLDRGNGQKQVTHSEHGTLDLRAPRIDGNETFKFNPDGSTEYEAEATLTIPSTAGTIKLTPVGGTAVTLTLGSDWRLVRNGNELTVN
ncbi:MAG TPA: RHS repeat domain-containing protein, partial [Burkholderiaceae bacterium]|nr:RHS repeat domain-containing protein [Burkholderiaceae bacterium]